MKWYRKSSWSNCFKRVLRSSGRISTRFSSRSSILFPNHSLPCSLCYVNLSPNLFSVSPEHSLCHVYWKSPHWHWQQLTSKSRRKKMNSQESTENISFLQRRIYEMWTIKFQELHCRRLPPVTACSTPLISMDKTQAHRDMLGPYLKIKLTKLPLNN